MEKKRLLDLFCGAGGSAKGYQDAGFYVVGVDIEPQPNYCGDEFYQADALTFLREYGDKFDVRHASPPCQASSNLTKGTNKGRVYPQLIPATRALLALCDGPSIIENVQGAKVRPDVTLCGEYFGLSVIRHRYFELEKCEVPQPIHKPHRGRVKGWRHGTYYDGPYFAVYGDGGGKGTLDEWRAAMGTYWMETRYEIAESIPPAYTKYIGTYL